MGAPSEDIGAWRRSILDILRSESSGGECRARPAAALPQSLEVVGFELGSETYGIEIGEVAEILLPRLLTPLPRAPAYIRGVVSLRGTVLPVLDLAGCLGVRSVPEGGRGSRIIVLRHGEERLGFSVDRVIGVLRFTGSEVETTGFASAVDHRFLKGIGCERNGNLVGVLSGDSLWDFDLEERG